MYDALGPESLAGWYLRLNGLFTIQNFVLHPIRRGPARTDADIAGLRLPYRREFQPGPGGDDSWFESHNTVPCAVIVEVKKGRCKVNGPWTSPADANVPAILRDLGFYPPEKIQVAAQSLYKDGWYGGAGLYCSLFCVGNEHNPEVKDRYPKVPQRTWAEVCDWIHARFSHNAHKKADHSQWDQAGCTLWTLSDDARGDTALFRESVRVKFKLPAA